MRKVTERVVMSFTCFAMFFGAGNLIFPVFLSYRAGANSVFAFLGFILSAITLPVLSLIAIGRTGSLDSLSSRVNPLFSKVFTIVIYLAIGPMLAIPRTASTSYEMVRIAFSLERDALSWAYSFIFFLLAGLIALHPEKLSKRLGKVLSPILIGLIIFLFISVFFMPSSSHVTVPPYDDKPLLSGILDGYQTMDAIAGLVFGTILAINIRKMGIEDENEIRREGVISSIGGGILLLIIYSLLSIIGYRAFSIVENPNTGADILSGAASFLLPSYGRILIAAIFILACFNTSVGLLSSCGEYFSTICPSLSRGRWIFLFALISGLIANVGLDMIISISSPILEVIYPVAITLMLLAFIKDGNKIHLTYKISILVSFIFSLIGIFTSLSFLWLIPTAIAAIVSFLFERRKSK